MRSGLAAADLSAR
jgi:hypothetical protein